MLFSESNKANDDDSNEECGEPDVLGSSNGGNNGWQDHRITETTGKNECTKQLPLKRQIEIRNSQSKFKIPDTGEEGSMPSRNKKLKTNNCDEEPTTSTGTSIIETSETQNGTGTKSDTPPQQNDHIKQDIIHPQVESSTSHHVVDQSDNSAAASTSNRVIKTEPNDIDDPQPSSSVASNSRQSHVKVEKADASSTTSRESCKYGIRCYRRNPVHRAEEAHPGDSDYRRPNFPSPPKGTPDCPYGNNCYRRNPIHFQKYAHPLDTDFQQNYKNYRLRLRQRRQRQQNNNNSSELDDYDLDDPFINDSESDYVPSDEDDDDDDDNDIDDDFRNCNEEELDYDDCDKVEE